METRAGTFRALILQQPVVKRETLGVTTPDHRLAASVGALDVNLYGALSGIGPQNFFAYNPGLQAYTSHTDKSRGFIPHPVWEALQMRNNYCSGDITTRLHFVDGNGTPVGGRVMNVIVNGVQLLTNFDSRAVAGVGMKAVVEDLKTESSNTGTMTVSIVRESTYFAPISGFQVISGH